MMHQRKLASHSEYLSRKYFSELDGLRAVAVLLVVAVHTGDTIWANSHGQVGVTIFFVLSGYLITTLLLREEELNGKISITAFYIRRSFRILPLYFVALLAFSIAVFGLGSASVQDEFLNALPWYLTYQNEFAPPSFFHHTWSLAVEEKYYLIWPLLFAMHSMRRHRLATLIVLAVSTAIGAFFGSLGAQLATYTPIVLGCLAALLLHGGKTFSIFGERLARTSVATGLFVLLGADLWFVEDNSHVHILFGILVTLMIPWMILRPSSLRRALQSPIPRYLGTRSYGIYLFHNLSKEVVDQFSAPGSASIILQCVRYVFIVCLSVAAAEILHRAIERPFINLGRRLARGVNRKRNPEDGLPDVSHGSPNLGYSR